MIIAVSNSGREVSQEGVRLGGHVAEPFRLSSTNTLEAQNNVALVSFGSPVDLQPMYGLAQACQNRGECTINTNAEEFQFVPHTLRQRVLITFMARPIPGLRCTGEKKPQQEFLKGGQQRYI